MNKPLSGAVFQLFEVGNGASGDVQRNGKWYKPVTYLHAYNHEDDAHYAAADLTAEDTLLGSMTVGETGNLYPTRLHHSVGDAIYFMTLPAGNGYAAGYTDIHLSQARDGLALERGKQYYLLEVVTPEGYEKEDIFWSFIIDDMDFFDSRNGIYQYRDGGVLTVSNETQDDSGIVLSKKFDGDAADAMDWDQVEFEIVGKDGDNVIYRREVSYSDFVKKKLKLTDIPAGAYTITEKNADDVTLTRETSMTITKEGGEAVTPEQTDGDSYVRFSVTQEDIDSGTAFYVAFTNTYTEKPLDIELSKEWGEDALARLSDKTLTLALFRDGEEYPLYQDAEGKYRFWSEEDAAHDRSYITLSNATTWTANIRELPRYEDGRAIEWTVKEIGASYSQDGVRYTVSEEDMDVQFIITAKAQTGTDAETEEPIYETVPVSQCTAALDTTSSEITNLTLTNELATLKIVTVEKEWYDEDGNLVTDKTNDDAVVYDLYRTTEELPKGGKERNTLKVLPYRSDSTHLSDMEHILTNEIEVANGDVLEFEVEALAKNVNAAGTWWAWWFDFTSPVIHLDCSPWEQSLSIISVKNEMGEDLADVPTTRYSNSAYSQTAKNPKVYIQVVINNVEHINGHQNSLPEYRNTPSLLLRNWKDANITVRNATQESENLTHAKLQAFVDTHPNTAELYREGITLDQLHSWQESSNYPDGYTYFASERTPAGYADTYSIVDNEDGSETITIKNAPIDTSEPGNLGTLTVTKAVAGLPSESHGDMEFKFQIKTARSTSSGPMKAPMSCCPWPR